MLRDQVLAALSDGRFHSGAALAERLGVSRAAVWKQVEALRALGVPVDAVSGKGYRLPAAVQLLDGARIQASLARRGMPVAVEVQLAVPSTNTCLLERAREGGPPQALLAEIQTAGRGRWGRGWRSGFGCGLYLSLSWRFPVVPSGLMGLSLACGAVIAERLRALGAADIGVKWPNDILTPAGKLGGILIELVGEPSGPCGVVIGVGLNLRLSVSERAAIGQPVAELEQYLPGVSGRRNELAAELIAALAGMCEDFSRSGLAPYQARWREYDTLLGKPVILQLPDGPLEGVCEGIDASGALRLRTASGSESFVSGDVQLKLRHAPAS